MSDTRKLAIRGVAISWLGHACVILITLFVTPILVREMGDVTYGIWSIVMTLTSYYGLIDLGIGKANTKYIAQFDAQHDDESLRKLMATSFVTYTRFAVVVLAVAALVALVFPGIVDLGSHRPSVIRWVIMLTGLKVSLQLIGALFRTSIVARRRFDIANLHGIAIHLANAGLLVWIVRRGGGLDQMAWAMLIVAFAVECSHYFFAIKVLGLPRPRLRDFDRGMRTTLLSFGVLTLVRKAARKIGTYSGAIIIGVIVGPAGVTYFSISQSLTEKCQRLGRSINQITMPVASQMDAEQHSAGLIKLMVLAPRVLLGLGGTFAVCLIALGHSFLTHWMSPEFADRGYPIFCVLSLAMVVRFPANGLYSGLEGIGHVAYLSRVAALEAVLSIGLGITLVWSLGLVGMAWALFIAQFVTGGVILPLYISRLVNQSPWMYAARVIAPAAACWIPGIITAILLLQFRPARNHWEALFHMGIVSAVSGLAMFWLCLDPEMRKAALRLAPRRRVRTAHATEGSNG